MFNIVNTCSENCYYAGLFQDSYTICRCSPNATDIHNKFEIITYNEKPFSNVRVVDCESEALNPDNIRSNRAFWLVFIYTLITLVTVIFWAFCKNPAYIRDNKYQIMYSELRECFDSSDRVDIYSEVTQQVDMEKDNEDKNVVVYSNITKGSKSKSDISCIKDYLDNFKYNSSLLGLVYNYSLMYPFWMRVLSLSFFTTLDFLIICCFFTDTEIESRAYFMESNGNIATHLGYSWRNNTPFAIYTTLLSIGFTFVFGLLMKVFSSQKVSIINALKSGNDENIILEYDKLNSAMRIRRILYITLITVLHCLCWYYFTCFSFVYQYTYDEIINVFLIVIVFKHVIAEIVLCTFKWLLRITGVKALYEFFVY
jgi:hypothetical protein